MYTISMRTQLKSLFIAAMFLGGVFLNTAYAETIETCPGPGETQAQCEARLNAKLQQVLQEQDAIQKQLNQTQAQVGTLKGAISTLNKKIDLSATKIKAHSIVIGKLSGEIVSKQETVDRLNEKLNRQKASLAQILRKSNELSNTSIVEFALQSKTISDFFADADSYHSVQAAMAASFKDIEGTKEETLTQKEQLEQKKTEQEDLKTQQLVEKKKTEENKAITTNILNETKGIEQKYQQSLKEKQAEAAKIRSALFALRDSSSIQFGDALDYATAAFEVTGVRPAFLLAILTQESNLGQNTGRCYLTNTSTGSGVRTTGAAVDNVMHPTRDVPAFVAIASELGFEPSKRLVSCPLSYGYGGAMGPAQFIPSTWNLMKAKIAAALGVSTPDPWRARDAFFASSLYLRDIGGATDERNAACKYYSGRSCASSSAGASYGNSVVAKAKKIQETQINPLQGL